MVSYQLRTNYLESIPDGIGERLITLNNAFLGSSDFRAARWRQIEASCMQTHSPPIPTGIASEYFQAPPKLKPNSLNSPEEYNIEGGTVVDDGATNGTVGTENMTKRRRRREQLDDEEDSSDMSDESDDDVDQAPIQQIKFSKMPVRRRSGSSPIRGSNLRASSNTTLLSRTPPAQERRGSQSALEAIKLRARGDTVTSSEISSDNEFDASAFQRRKEAARSIARRTKIFLKPSFDLNLNHERPISSWLEKEAEEDSDESGIDSDFAVSLDSASIMPGIKTPINASPDNFEKTPSNKVKKSPANNPMPAPEILTELPPARPISTIQPKSLLSAAIKAKRTKASMPFESFASLSGQAESNPLNLRIWAPFTTSTTKRIEVLIRRHVHENDASERPVTVVDLIGLSLWRYGEEKLEPPIPEDKRDINRWTLRLVEDEEVDYDFPALDRTKPVAVFSTANNKAVRSRSGIKPYDEFALVGATDEEFAENQKITCQFKQEIITQNDELALNTSKPVNFPASSFTSITSIQPRPNPVVNPRFAHRGNVVLADTPIIGAAVTNSQSRLGTHKSLRIHITSTDATGEQMIPLDVTTDIYLADVLDMICKKKQLDKAAHVLKLSGSGTLVLLDRTVESIGNRMDLDLARRRFATDGPLTLTGSPSSSSPKMSYAIERPESRKFKKGGMMGTHPLAQHSMKQDEVGSANYRKYTVWRKQPMRFVGMNERLLVIDGEYLHIMPASTSKTLFEGQGKTTTVHFSNIIGCKITRRHPSNFKV